MASEIFKCFYNPCKRNFFYLRDLVNHMRNEHFLETVSFVCGIDGCTHTHHSVSTFRKHAIYTHSSKWNAVKLHAGSASLTSSSSTASDAAASSSEVFNSGDEQGLEITEQAPGEIANQVLEPARPTEVAECTQVTGQQERYTELIQSVLKQFWSLRLRLCYEFHLPEWKAAVVLDSVSDLLKLLKTEISQCLSVSLVGDTLSDEDVFILRDNASLNSVLNVTRGQEKLVLSQLGYIEPEEIVFSSDTDSDKECGHYVPVEKSLTNYLSRPDVYASIQSEITEAPVGFVQSMSSGLIMSSHPVFSVNKRGIRLKLYTDEFQIGNPLRGNKKLSISAVYFSVDNIEPHLSGKSTHVHLAFLVKEYILKKYSKDVVWGRMLQDLRRLESDGLQLQINGDQEKLDVGVSVICGDSKSLLELGGFNCCFSSGKVCRKCLVEFADLLEVSNESQCVLKTKEDHDKHVEEVLLGRTLGREYGVSGASAFSVINSFHPVTSLPSDIMHDTYEGQMPFNIRAVVKGLIHIHDGVLNMNDIHTLMNHFEYGGCDADNKFPGFSGNFPGKRASFPGTASQKRNLFRMFPLIVGPRVPPNNRFWKLHLKLQEISDILLAPCVDVGWIAYLAELVDEYVSLWSKLPQEVVGSFKPKGHYLVHMAHQTYFLGPPRYVACMVFEHFHQNFKQTASLMSSFKNPTLTMATAFQKKRCLEYSSSDICSSVSIRSAQSDVSVDTLSCLERNALARYTVVEGATLLTVSKVKVKGRYLVKGAYVIVDVNHENVPIFLKVVSIYRYVDQWIVYGKLTFPFRWCEHLHSYELVIDDDDENYVCVSPSEVVPLQTLSLYKVNGKPYLKLRHRPMSPQ